MKFRNNISILDQYTSGAITKIVFYLLGIILLSISSKISIPFFPVPMTLQTFVVYFIAASMGMVGFYSTISYVALGLMGLPIFAAGGGIAYIMSPTFGFLSLGALIIFVCGIIHLAGYIGLEKALTAGLYPFIYSEFLKITLAILVAYLLIKKN